MEIQGHTIQNGEPSPTNPARIYNKDVFEFMGNKVDLSMIFLSAERYALGRATYIVNWTCEVIANNLDLITLKDKKVMIRDIKNASYLGWECDKRDWMNLLKILEKRVEEEEREVK
jgi:hypothetical protein